MAEMLPVREGAKELARRAGRFARDEPTRPSVAGGATDIRTLVLQVGGGEIGQGGNREQLVIW